MNPKLRTLYYISFFLSIQYAFTAYVNSTFLGNFFQPVGVGLIFSLSAFMAVLWLTQMPKIVERFGNFKTYLTLVISSTASLLGIALWNDEPIAVIFFVLYLVLNYLIMFPRDIFVENYSENKSTGRTRGALLTVINLGWVFAPLFSGLLLGLAGFSSVYLMAVACSLPAIFVTIGKLRDFQDPAYEKISVWSAIKKVFQDKSLSMVYFSGLLLQLFYSWMIVYTPIYLFQTMNFSWENIGLIFVAMLTPFVLLEIPLGRLSDRIGEKKMLYTGFAIMGITTATLTFLGADLWLWALMLFLTRVGAATVEVMTETYFFKKIAVKDAEIISLFRNTAPLAFILGPVLATLLLVFLPMQYIFMASGLTVLLGIIFTSQLEETI